MYTYIIHPVTNQRIPVNSKEGSALINTYVKYLKQSHSKIHIEGKPNNCNGLKKHKSPRCTEQSNCEWIKHKGCNVIGDDLDTVEIKKPSKTTKPAKSKKSKKLPDIQTILGPTDMFYWEVTCPNKTVKKFILLSDTHTEPTSVSCQSRKAKCYHIDECLKLIINKAEIENKCIDMFVEGSQRRPTAPDYLIGGKLKKSGLILDQIIEYYNNCSLHSWKEAYVIGPCNNTNLRFHNLDLRFSQKNNFRRNNNKLESLLFYLKNQPTFFMRSNYNLLAEYILGYNITKKKKTLIKNLLHKILTSEKKTLHDDTPLANNLYTVDDILNEMRSFRKIVRKEYRKLRKNSNMYLDERKGNLREIIKNIVYHNLVKVNNLTEYTHLFSDFYVICRIFMEFSTDKGKIERSPERCNIIDKHGNKTINISPNKIIIFAGGDHINLYNQILTHYFPDAIKNSFSTSKYSSNKFIDSSDIQPRIGSFTEIFQRFLA